MTSFRLPEPNLRLAPTALALAAFVWGALALGCSRPGPVDAAKPDARRVQSVSALDSVQSQQIGALSEKPAWIAHVIAVDLDQDGRVDAVYCDSRDSTVVWLRQVAPGQFTEIVVGANLLAPVHVEAADMNGDGRLDLLVGSMGEVFPNNDKIGTVFILENDGRGGFRPHTVLENASRVTDLRAADLNGDGRLDLALAQFGYDQGEVSWLERTGPWEFRLHVLLDLSGAINVCVSDFDQNGTPDLVALISQQWEEIYLFSNRGRGEFTSRRIWGSTNEDYGSSGISLCDLNRDGRDDVLYTNGDGFGPAATPGPRPWHGVQWLENKGDGNFRYHRIATLPGAYSPVGVDFDGDGATDILAVAAYADWGNKNRNVASLMWYRNDGRMGFEPHILARTPRDQITLAVGDFDGNGRPVLVTGGFYVYPPYDPKGRINLWRRK